MSCLPWSAKQHSQTTCRQNPNVSWECQRLLLLLAEIQQNRVAEGGTGEGGKEPEMQNLSNQSRPTCYSAADVEDKIVSRDRLRRMEGRDMRMERCRCVTGEKAQMASLSDSMCVATNCCWRLTFGLHPSFRRDFNGFGGNCADPYESAEHTISQVFTEVRSTHRPVASNTRCSLFHCISGVLPTVSFVETMLPPAFYFLVWGLVRRLQPRSVRLKEAQMFTYAFGKC